MLLGANPRTHSCLSMLAPDGRDLPPDRPRDTVESTVCLYDSDTGAERTTAPYDTSVRPSAYAQIALGSALSRAMQSEWTGEASSALRVP